MDTKYSFFSFLFSFFFKENQRISFIPSWWLEPMTMILGSGCSNHWTNTTSSKIKVRVRKLWSREHKLLFRKTSIYMIFIFRKFPFSGNPLLCLQLRLSLSLFTVAADFRWRYLAPPAISGHKTGLMLFISSSFSIAYQFSSSNFNVGREVKEKKSVIFCQNCLFFRSRFHPNWLTPSIGLQSLTHQRHSQRNKSKGEYRSLGNMKKNLMSHLN